MKNENKTLKCSRKNLERERKNVDRIDLEITKLLDKGIEVVSKIRKAKDELGMPICQPGREKQVLERVRQISKNPDFSEGVFKMIMEESKRFQEELRWAGWDL
jgi:chorismate mutase